MNCELVKRIPLPQLLSKMGFTPYRYTGMPDHSKDWWYFSPFREEKTPSFKINVAHNIWYDHGMGVGGNVIDFIMQYYHVIQLQEVFQKISELMGSEVFFPFHQPSHSQLISKSKAERHPVEILKIKYLENRALIAYLLERKIDVDIARIYLKEMYYRVNERNYFAMAFKTDQEGYELRNRYWKGCVGKKEISTLSAASTSVAFFEEFMDYLSALTYHQKERASADVVVMNSTALKERAFLSIEDRELKYVFLYLDTDSSGRETLRYFMEKLQCPVVDRSCEYQGYKDFNEFLMRTSCWK